MLIVHLSFRAKYRLRSLLGNVQKWPKMGSWDMSRNQIGTSNGFSNCFSNRFLTKLVFKWIFNQLNQPPVDQCNFWRQIRSPELKWLCLLMSMFIMNVNLSLMTAHHLPALTLIRAKVLFLWKIEPSYILLNIYLCNFLSSIRPQSAISSSSWRRGRSRWSWSTG